VLITGCSGYVGHQIALRLASADFEVIGTSRRPFELPGVAVAVGDHLEPTFVSSAVDRCDAVVHFAARTRGHDAASFARDNEDVTRTFCREATRLGKRFVHISSDQAVYQTGLYGKSKRACEDIVTQEGRDYAILRLTAVLGRYAPEMNSTFSKIIRKLHSSPFLVVPGSCEFPIAPVWIGDIERAVRWFLEAGAMPDDVCEVCGPVLTLAALIDLFEQRLGKRRMRVRLPLRPIQAVARLLAPFRAFARLPLDALLDLGKPVGVSPAKLTAIIGQEPTSMADAVPRIEGFPA